MRISPRDFRRAFFDDYFILRRSLRRRQDENATTYPNVACFAFDSITSEIIMFGRFEKMLLDVIFSQLDPLFGLFRETAAIDVGANIGNHSLYFAPLFGHVCSIEASPKTFALLSFNVTYSGYSNITPIQVALGESRGKLTFAEHRNHAGRSGVIDPANTMCDTLCGQPGRLLEVDVEAGDTVLSHHKLPPVSLIKIDVEGFESAVIKGLKSTIESSRPIILIEQLASEIRSGTSESVELLREFGYDEFYAPESTSRVANRYLRILTKLLLGETIDLVAIDSFLPKHYPMVLCSASSSSLSLKRLRS